MPFICTPSSIFFFFEKSKELLSLYQIHILVQTEQRAMVAISYVVPSDIFPDVQLIQKSGFSRSSTTLGISLAGY